MRATSVNVLVVLLLVSCNQNRHTEREHNSVFLGEKDFFVFNLEKGIQDVTDTIVLNDFIHDISYIPLETGKGFLLPGFSYSFVAMREDFFISGGSYNRGSPIYQFDSLGRFVRPINYYGRGPNEVPMLMQWYANVNIKQINIIGTGAKMVIVQPESGDVSSVRINERQGFNLVPLNDSSFVSTQNLWYKDIPETYLYFIDQAGNIVHSIERDDKKLRYNYGNIPEGAWTGPYEAYWLTADYMGDAIFHDIFNDTLYRIKNHKEISPHLVFERGSLSPSPADTYKQENKKKQIYFTHVKESSDYVFLNYYYNDKRWCDVWSKHDNRLMIHASPETFGTVSDVFVPFALPNGTLIELQVVYTDKDNIYCIIEALDACKFLPDVKEDDNPVIMVAKLKPPLDN